MSKFFKNMSQQEAERLFYDKGYFIVDAEGYKNGVSRLAIEDEDGYKYLQSAQSISVQKQKRPFDNRNPYTVENIRLWLKNNDPDYELVSTEYKHSSDKLEWRKLSRPDLPTFFTSWHMFYSDGNRHPLVGIEKVANSRRKKPHGIRIHIEKILKERYPGWSLDEGRSLIMLQLNTRN